MMTAMKQNGRISNSAAEIDGRYGCGDRAAKCGQCKSDPKRQNVNSLCWNAHGDGGVSVMPNGAHPGADLRVLQK